MISVNRLRIFTGRFLELIGNEKSWEATIFYRLYFYRLYRLYFSLYFRFLCKDIVPQFIANTIIFCAIVVVSQLVRLSNVLMAFGLSAENILLPFLYIILPFLPVILTVAFLFALVSIIARLSLDGEIIAIQARGMSLLRFSLAPLAIGMVLSAVASVTAHYGEAWGRREFVQFVYRKTHVEIDNVLHTKLQPAVFLHDFLDYVLYAEKISPDHTTLSRVLVANSQGSKNKFILLAKKAKLHGSINEGNLKVHFFEGFSYTLEAGDEQIKTTSFDEGEIDLLQIFHERILGQPGSEDDFRSYPPQELSTYIDSLKQQGTHREILAKAQYLWHARFANALLLISFSLLGVLLGLHDPRSLKAPIFLKTIATVIFCFSFISVFRWCSENNYCNPFINAWLPQLLLFAFSLWALLRRNRLPAAEPLFKNLATKLNPRLIIKGMK